MGVFKTEKEYHKSIDTDRLVYLMENYLKEDKWKVQTVNTKSGKLLQARKGGILRDMIAAERSLNILFSKTPDGLKVTIGVGKWLQNISVAVVETLLLSELFLAIDVPEMLWNAEIERKVVRKLDDLVAQT